MRQMKVGFLLLVTVTGWLTCLGAVSEAEVAQIKDWQVRTGELPRDPDEKPVDVPDDMKLVLLIGQSNMAGRGPVPDVDRQPLARAFKMNRDDQWVPAAAPFHFDRKTAGMSPANQFVKRYLADHPNETVGVVPCAVGGSSQITWLAEGTDKVGANFRRALKRAQLAAKKGRFVAILWHQGEADAAKPEALLKSTYPTRFSEMIGAFRREIGPVPVVLGEIGRFFKHDVDGRVNRTLNSLPAVVTNCACVSSDGLKSKGDEVHFGTADAAEFGNRYYEAFKKLSVLSR